MLEPATPICPKCGYDQSGIISTWEDRCPLNGTCPECGLQFQWADIMDPARIHLPWYIEHASRKRTMLRRTPATWWYLLIPNRFWRRLGVERIVRAQRAWLWLLMLTIIFYSVSVVITIISHALSTMHWNTRLTVMLSQNPGLGNRRGFQVTDMSEISYWLEVIRLSARSSARGLFRGQSESGLQAALVMGGMIALWIVVLAAVPTTRRIAKLRFAHISRAAALSLMGCLLLVFVSDLAESAANIDMIYSPSTYRGGRASTVEIIAQVTIVASVVAAYIWLQWFWITACLIGWRIRSIALLMLTLIASLLGGFTVFAYLAAY